MRSSGGLAYSRRLTPTTVTDSLLARAISQAKQGDQSALHFIYARHADDVFACVNTIVADSGQAQETTQDLFAGLARTIHRYDGHKTSFATWIEREARRAAVARGGVRQPGSVAAGTL